MNAYDSRVNAYCAEKSFFARKYARTPYKKTNIARLSILASSVAIVSTLMAGYPWDHRASHVDGQDVVGIARMTLSRRRLASLEVAHGSMRQALAEEIAMVRDAAEARRDATVDQGGEASENGLQQAAAVDDGGIVGGDEAYATPLREASVETWSPGEQTEAQQAEPAPAPAAPITWQSEPAWHVMDLGSGFYEFDHDYYCHAYYCTHSGTSYGQAVRDSLGIGTYLVIDGVGVVVTQRAVFSYPVSYEEVCEAMGACSSDVMIQTCWSSDSILVVKAAIA